MLQLDNFPADGSIIIGLANGVYACEKKEDRFFKFLNKTAFLKSFKTRTGFALLIY